MTHTDIGDRKFVLIKRKTRLKELILRYNTIEQAKFYIEHLGGDFSDYVEEDRIYQHAISDCKEILEKSGRLQIIDRDFISNFIFGADDIVIAIGQDGLVANTLKYLSGQPLIGINPDRKRWDGILLPFLVSDLPFLIPDVMDGNHTIREVTMAKASLADGQVLYGVNDLFIGQKSHISSRYSLKIGEKQENQSSSGIIVSTGLGSSGWFKSIIAGAAGIIKGYVDDSFQKDRFEIFEEMRWDSDFLYYSVREPFPSISSGADLVFGRVLDDEPLEIRSNMPENGVIFSDGIESDYLEFNSGTLATVSLADKRGHLVW